MLETSPERLKGSPRDLYTHTAIEGGGGGVDLPSPNVLFRLLISFFFSFLTLLDVLAYRTRIAAPVFVVSFQLLEF